MGTKFKKLAFALLGEDNEKNEALINIAQEILELHLDKDEKEFNEVLMPPEEVLPNESKSYEKIEKLVKKALEADVSDIEKVI